MAGPRILLVPWLTELKWQIKPLLEEWAEVASFDAPGVGGEPPAPVSPEAPRGDREWIRRVPLELAIDAMRLLRELLPTLDNAEVLRHFEGPLLVAEHVGCLAWTRERFEDAVAELPQARVVRTTAKPSTSPEFAAAVRELCRERGLVQ